MAVEQFCKSSIFMLDALVCGVCECVLRIRKDNGGRLFVCHAKAIHHLHSNKVSGQHRAS